MIQWLRSLFSRGPARLSAADWRATAEARALEIEGLKRQLHDAWRAVDLAVRVGDEALNARDDALALLRQERDDQRGERGAWTAERLSLQRQIAALEGRLARFASASVTAAVH